MCTPASVKPATVKPASAKPAITITPDGKIKSPLLVTWSQPKPAPQPAVVVTDTGNNAPQASHLDPEATGAAVGILVSVVGTIAAAAFCAGTAGVGCLVVAGVVVGAAASATEYSVRQGVAEKPIDPGELAKVTLRGGFVGGVLGTTGSAVRAVGGAATNLANASAKYVINKTFQFGGGGRGGQFVKTFVGPPNSVVKGAAPGRIHVTDDAGRVIKDITRGRTKTVVPGEGYAGKVTPTPLELEWIDELWGK